MGALVGALHWGIVDTILGILVGALVGAFVGASGFSLGGTFQGLLENRRLDISKK
jgi:hypothetical protein